MNFFSEFFINTVLQKRNWKRETRFEHSKMAPHMNLRFDIFECSNHGFFSTSSLVSAELYGRKILKKIPGVLSGETYRLNHDTLESAI